MSVTQTTEVKVSADRDELLGALLAVDKFAARTHHIDQFRWFRFKVDGNDGLMLASNGDVAAAMSLPIQPSQSSFDVLLPRRLTDVVKSMPSGARVDLTFKDGRVAVTSGKGTRFKLGLTALEPMEIDAGHDADWVGALDLTQELKDELATAATFCGNDPGRPILHNVHLGDGAIVSTDSHRMYHALVDADGWPELTIPRYAVAELGRVAASELLMSENSVYGRSGDFCFRARRIDGAFPNIASMIDATLADDKSSKVEVDVDELIEAVGSVGAISSGPSQVMSLTFDDGIVVELNNQDGDAREKVGADVGGLESLTVGFNLDQLYSGLKLFKGPLTVQVIDSRRPVVMHAGSRRYMVAPVRI